MDLKNKVGIVMGIANNRSIAASISEKLRTSGVELGFSHLPDNTGKMENRIRKVVEAWEPKLLAPCDVNSDADVKTFFAAVAKTFGKIDFLVHSVAYAPAEDIRCSTVDSSRAGFLQAMDTSVYSFISVAKAASEIMNENGSILTLTYFGGEKVVAGYNMMGVAKSALDSAVRYLAFDLGSKSIRVNGLSAGPLKTLAASAIGDFRDMLNMNAAIAPLGRNVTHEEVANSALFLLSPMASGITGEILHVDGGYNIMGSPGRAFDKWGIKPRDVDGG